MQVGFNNILTILYQDIVDIYINIIINGNPLRQLAHSIM
jgi:hypothetical protein